MGCGTNYAANSRPAANNNNGCMANNRMMSGNNNNCGTNDQMTDRKNNSCNTNVQMTDRNRNTFPDIPTDSKAQLLQYIDEVSFGAYDTMLYLDTHPEDPDAIRFFQECSKKRKMAMKAYAEHYGPLNFSQVARCDMGSLQWVSQPWPWEGGDC